LKLKGETPADWPNYSSTSQLMKILRDKMPKYIYYQLNGKFYSIKQKTHVGRLSKF